MSHRLASSLAAFAFAFAVAVPALADVSPPPPNTTQCDGLAEGDACVTDAKKEGACTKQTCTGYGECLVCVEGAAGGGCSFAAGHGGTAAALLALLAVPVLVARRRRRSGLR